MERFDCIFFMKARESLYIHNALLGLLLGDTNGSKGVTQNIYCYSSYHDIL